MKKLTNLMPSFIHSLIALIFGALLAWLFYELDNYARDHGWRTVDQLIWGMLLRLGWWFWGIPVIMSLAGLLHMATLDRPGTTLGFVIRIMALSGFNLYLFSFVVTGFGPVAALLIVTSFVLLIRQQAMACAAKRPKTDWSGAPLAVRMFVALSTDIKSMLK